MVNTPSQKCAARASKYKPRLGQPRVSENILMLSILWRVRVVARRDGVFTYDSMVTTHRRKFAAPLVLQHFAGSVVCIALRVVKTRSALRIVALVDPLAIGALVNSAVLVLAHIGTS